MELIMKKKTKKKKIIIMEMCLYVRWSDATNFVVCCLTVKGEYPLRAANSRTLAHAAAAPNGYLVAARANIFVAALEHAARRVKLCR